MKALISKIESILVIGIKFQPEGGATLNAKISGPGNPPHWEGELSKEEISQLAFRLNEISNGELQIEGAEDIVKDSKVYADVVQRQVSAIDELTKRAEKAEKQNDELINAVKNQRDVIDDLRTKLARTDNVQTEPVKADILPDQN